MLKTTLALTALLLAPGLAAAQPIGEWMVKDKVATIKIDECDGAMWGVVAWEKDPGGLDTNNPDPAKRSRPTLGMPIIIDMKATEANRWEGEIYNSQNGRTYTARIMLSKPDVLRVEGCVLGFLCGGEEWTRVAADAALPGRRPAPPAKKSATDVSP